MTRVHIGELSVAMNRARRGVLLKTLSMLATWIGLAVSGAARGQMSESELSKIRERMRQAREQEAKEVERLYSTKPVRVRMGGREYVIPANHFGPKQRDKPGSANIKDDNGFGFFLFLSDYGGYTKENWRDRFDRRLITVLQVSTVDKNAIVPILGGGSEQVKPANYGEPKARFGNRKSSLEDVPSLKLYDLEGYRWRGGEHRASEVTWTGTRSNGEFFFFESSLAPGEPAPYADHNPLCKVQYYSEREDLFIAYFYSQDHVAKWREIDDAIWAKLHGWRVN